MMCRRAKQLKMQYRFGLLLSLCKTSTFEAFIKLSTLRMDVLKQTVIVLHFLVQVTYTKYSSGPAPPHVKERYFLHKITKSTK
jgi:hypothetical protein